MTAPTPTAIGAALERVAAGHRTLEEMISTRIAPPDFSDILGRFAADAILLAAEVERLRGVEAENERLRDALKPFAAEHAKKNLRYENVGSTWHNEMPGDWPVNIAVAVSALRAATAAAGQERAI